jgi:hypothetical protein
VPRIGQNFSAPLPPGAQLRYIQPSLTLVIQYIGPTKVQSLDSGGICMLKADGIETSSSEFEQLCRAWVICRKLLSEVMTFTHKDGG